MAVWAKFRAGLQEMYTKLEAMVSWVCTNVKTYQIVQLEYMEFVVGQWYFNKIVLQEVREALEEVSSGCCQ